MKWISGETKDSKLNRRENWSKWFAWYPVAVDEIKIKNKTRKIRVWLEFIERRKSYSYNHHFNYYIYRKIGDRKD